MWAGPQRSPRSWKRKIIIHYGSAVAPVKVGSRIKLLGKEVVVAYRFVKMNSLVRIYRSIPSTYE
ncbi:DUF2652 domain-containing protein [Maribacter chungangensis]|uniref:DUF2652 domain-containing protein n=1 Tax=Maribacter chungangensis TaxID=1069117 RepID=A0ABW3B4X9_9FLAO